MTKILPFRKDIWGWSPGKIMRFDKETIDLLADIVEKSIDLDLLIKNLPEINVSKRLEPISQGPRDKTVRIAVARDSAFCFYYQDNLELLEGQGAELAFFSPIAGDNLPQDIDGLYIGGGYPELFGDKLAGNRKLRGRIKAKSDAGHADLRRVRRIYVFVRILI